MAEAAKAALALVLIAACHRGDIFENFLKSNFIHMS